MLGVLMAHRLTPEETIEEAAEQWKEMIAQIANRERQTDWCRTMRATKQH
jgi:hypothetical protein